MNRNRRDWMDTFGMWLAFIVCLWGAAIGAIQLMKYFCRHMTSKEIAIAFVFGFIGHLVSLIIAHYANKKKEQRMERLRTGVR